jgi:hypothetical protein
MILYSSQFAVHGSQFRLLAFQHVVQIPPNYKSNRSHLVSFTPTSPNRER